MCNADPFDTDQHNHTAEYDRPRVGPNRKVDCFLSRTDNSGGTTWSGGVCLVQVNPQFARQYRNALSPEGLFDDAGLFLRFSTEILDCALGLQLKIAICPSFVFRA